MVIRHRPVRPVLLTPVATQGQPAITHRPYDQTFRRMAIAKRLAGQDDDDDIVALRAAKSWPSKSSVRRWIRRLIVEGRLAPYRHTGNKRATVLRGHDLVLLAQYRACFPKALLAEVAAFLWNAWGRFQNPPVLRSLPDISKAEKRLGFTRKRGATTAYQAHLWRNKQRRKAFWRRPWPHGIADVAAADMIDVDEAGVYLETADRRYGKAQQNIRVRQPGNYGHSTKWTLIMAIAGRRGNNDRYAEFTKKAGTDVVTFANFIQAVIHRVGPGGGNNCRCFTFDNLTAHKHPVVLQMMLNAGHRYALRAPYYPVDGPIEYVFNAIGNKLTTNMHEIRDEAALTNHMWAAINSFDHFEGFFRKVGFR